VEEEKLGEIELEVQAAEVARASEAKPIRMRMQ